MQMFWFIPTTGDGRYLGDSRQTRKTNLRYLKQIATAVDELGFEGVLLPTGNLCEDAWVVASGIMPFTRRLKFLVAVRPTITSATEGREGSHPACDARGHAAGCRGARGADCFLCHGGQHCVDLSWLVPFGRTYPVRRRA